jgi:hypothetical protein
VSQLTNLIEGKPDDGIQATEVLMYEVTPDQMNHVHRDVVVPNKQLGMFSNSSASLKRLRNKILKESGPLNNQ